MRVRTTQALQVLRRVHEHLTGNDIPVRAGSLAKHLENLDGVIGRLKAHGMEQDSSHRAARAVTVRKERLVTELRQEYMRPISQLAAQLFPEDAEMQRALAMPPFRDHERILNAAHAMIDRATPHKELFVAGGFAADFFERFGKVANELEQAIDEQSKLQAKRAAATAGQLDELRRGRDIVRLLDTMITPRLKATPNLAAEWRKLVRFRAVPSPADSPESTAGEGSSNAEVKAA